jgi:EAL domain-containing protein (putative c-di-GMP-specific phosphodiesterase class I)
MYMSKGKGKNRVEVYDAAADRATSEHHDLKADLVGAANRDELLVEYQPLVDLFSGSVVGVEALVRWQHPERGLLPPSVFIGVAEESGAILDVGSWVLRTATRQMRAWQDEHHAPELYVSVNVSVRQLDQRGFAAAVEGTLRRAGLSPTSLVLEVTESVMVDPDGEATATLEALRQLGVRVAIDDFGTGYSSIGYLGRLPVDILKIDRSFVSGEHSGSSGAPLLEAIVGLAQRLGLEIIPEGIEETSQLTRLRALGCHTGQGFLMSRPVAATAIDALLATSTRHPVPAA